MPKKTKKPVKIKRKGVSKQFTFTGLDNKEYTINQRQKLFAELYLDPFKTGIEVATLAGYDVYDKKGNLDKKMASSIATQNLSKLNISAYITLLMENEGLNNSFVDKHLSYNIKQFRDLNAKNVAIKEYNKIKGRHAPEKHEHAITKVEVINYHKPKRLKDVDNNTTS